MTETHPKDNAECFGHEAAERLLQDEFTAGKLAHGIIIAGPQGIGKATLAYRFARSLFAGEPDVSSSHPVFHRVAAGSHADLLVVEPVFDEKKGEYARDISVDQAREVAKFLSMTPGEGGYRVVIIDSADALNPNAANAILKILEEPPPQAVLLLVSHNPGRLLATIRSRCRLLKLKPLAKQDFTKTLRHIAPSIEPSHMDALSTFSNGAPGLAAILNEQEACEWYAQILSLVSELPAIDPARLHAFADQVQAGQPHSNWRMLTRLMLTLFERVARQSAELPPDPILPDEDQALARLARLHAPNIWALKWQQCSDQFLLAERLHLDYKQMVIAFFHSIASKEGFQLETTAA